MKANFSKKNIGIAVVALLLLLVALSAFRGGDDEGKVGGLVAPTPTPTAYPWPTPTSAVNYSITPKNVFTFNCEIDEYKPETFFSACADGYTGIGKIKWSTWGINGATGTGWDYHNPCMPDCASDSIVYTQKYQLKLDTPIQMGKYAYLSVLHYVPIDASGKVTPGAKWELWDLGYNFRMMNSYMK